METGIQRFYSWLDCRIPAFAGMTALFVRLSKGHNLVSDIFAVPVDTLQPVEQSANRCCKELTGQPIKWGFQLNPYGLPDLLHGLSRNTPCPAVAIVYNFFNHIYTCFQVLAFCSDRSQPFF